MSNEGNKKPIQRHNAKSRKESLPKSGALFSDDAAADDASREPLDLDRLPLPDVDTEAIQSLSQLQGEVRAPVIVPKAERFPPTKPRIAQTPPEPPKQTPIPPPPRKPAYGLNILTLLAFVGMGGLLLWFAMIWQNPQTMLNPFPPPTPFIQVTTTPMGMLAADQLPTPNADGQIIIIATETPAQIATATDDAPPAPPFAVLDDVVYVPNGNGLGCNWSSIAGTVTDVAGNALNGYRIRITGADVNETVFSGAALTFGPGGFELPLLNTPQEAEYTLQLLSPQGAPVSEPLVVMTRADCDGNVLIVNFVQN